MITMFEPPLIISSRHTTAHRVVRCRETGVYEEVNGAPEGETEVLVQLALLAPPPSNLDRLWNQKRA